jgi:hypothetical protein
MQEFLVALIVVACTVYAAWTLMPSALRRALALRLQHWPWPPLLARSVRRAALAPTGCGCDGCDAKPPVGAKPADILHTIRIQRRPKP